MSRDRLLPPGVSKVHPRFGTPYITTIITCVLVALAAAFTNIQAAGEMTSIGTLFAFVVVCSAVLVLRKKRPGAKRPFRVPLGPVFPILGILSCAYLMLSLPVITWVRFLVWLIIPCCPPVLLWTRAIRTPALLLTNVGRRAHRAPPATLEHLSIWLQVPRPPLELFRDRISAPVHPCPSSYLW
jgi:amino acid transporter